MLPHRKRRAKTKKQSIGLLSFLVAGVGFFALPTASKKKATPKACTFSGEFIVSCLIIAPL